MKIADMLYGETETALRHTLDAYTGRAKAESHRYAEEFLRLKCSQDMLRFGLFPKFKEITESFAAYNAVMRMVPGVDIRDPAVHCFCVADGASPRTAATFAMRTAWTCYSIDPALNIKPWESLIRRLTVRREKVEDTEKVVCGKAVVVAVHSHADLAAAVAVPIAPFVAVVAIPCCVAQNLPLPPEHSFRDPGIWSPCNRVLVWPDIQVKP